MTRAPAESIALEPGTPVALLGQRVAFTGRLATLTHGEAERLVIQAAGRLAGVVTHRTTMLVVGMRGWPLMNSGHVTTKLAEAERLRAAGNAIRVLTETEFREALGIESPPTDVNKSLSVEQVCGTLGIDARTLQRWEHSGLIRSRNGLYDFSDLISLRTVTGLVARGVSPIVIRKSLDALSIHFPGVERPLAQLSILVSDSGHLVAELEEAMLTTSGQLEIRFDTKKNNVSHAALPLDRDSKLDGAAWIDAGIEHEEAGDLEEAEQAYRRAAALCPIDATPHFNLGNVLLARGRLEAAAERFLHATTLEPCHARAWFNLAHIEDSFSRGDVAIMHLRQAIQADPAFADAHYNLADLAERLGEHGVAKAAWESYLRLDSTSDWGLEARRRLLALRKAGA